MACLTSAGVRLISPPVAGSIPASATVSPAFNLPPRGLSVLNPGAPAARRWGFLEQPMKAVIEFDHAAVRSILESHVRTLFANAPFVEFHAYGGGYSDWRVTCKDAAELAEEAKTKAELDAYRLAQAAEQAEAAAAL